MERFREHEKEFKMKQYSKRALAASLENTGNFVSGDDDSDNSHSYGIEDSDENYEEDQYASAQQLSGQDEVEVSDNYGTK